MNASEAKKLTEAAIIQNKKLLISEGTVKAIEAAAKRGESHVDIHSAISEGEESELLNSGFLVATVTKREGKVKTISW